MNKSTCLCGEAMTFLMDNKRHTIWKCQNCGRLLLRPKYADWQRWFIPELDSRELPKGLFKKEGVFKTAQKGMGEGF